MLVKIFQNTYLNPDEVAFIIQYNSNASKRIYSVAKENGLLADLTKGTATKSLIKLKDGMIIATPFLPDTIVKKINVVK